MSSPTSEYSVSSAMASSSGESLEDAFDANRVMCTLNSP